MRRKGILMLALGIIVSGMYACSSPVGVEWVTDYSAVGKPNVPDRKPCAEGFYNTMIADSDWSGYFNKGNANAWEEHFKRKSKGGTDSDWIDDVAFAYFAGHGAGAGTVKTGVGTGGGFTFGVNAHDDWVMSAAPFNREPRWGDGDLNWIVLDVCSALAQKKDGAGYALSTRWANSDVMHGLHYILGFSTSATDSGYRGKIFAEYLTGKRGGKKHTVREAWRKATEDTEDYPYDGAYLRAYSPGADTIDDYISVSKDPDPKVQKYSHVSWPCY